MKGDVRNYWVVLGLAAVLAAGGCAHQKEGAAPGQSAKEKTPPAEAAQGQTAAQPDQDTAAPQDTPAAPKAPAAPTAIPPDQLKTTPSGLQYADLAPGTGPSPQAGQTVIVHYTGWLTNGSKFDSSLDRGMPFQFPLGQRRVIAGWDEGVATMKVGGKRQLVIPPQLGYGDRGFRETIPPNSTLVFEIELLGVR